MQSLAFVDLETTGATATADRITEIGIVEVDESGVREWSQLVNPEAPIPVFIQRMTGITDDMVREAPTFDRLAGEVLARLQGRLFIAHNARFDYGFLKNEFRRAGYDFRATVLCTVKLSRRLFPQYPRHNLDALIERHGLQAQGRHRALADAQLIHQFWDLVRESRSDEDLAALVKELTARPSLPAQLDPGVVDDLPEGPGVYIFYGEDDLPLFVGRAKDIGRRVLTHFVGDHPSTREMSLARQVRRIDWTVTGGEIGAQLKEIALIAQLRPTLNRQGRRNDELCAIALVDHGGGLVNAEIVYARDVDFGRQGNLYGLFRNGREATGVLAELAAAHSLCHAVLGLEKVTAGRPCFAHQVRKCKGICVGAEAPAAHTFRLVQALARLHLPRWPYAGPACIREGDDVHVVDGWCYLGSARSEDELWPLLEQSRPSFDRDTYRILVRAVARMVPLNQANRA